LIGFIEVEKVKFFFIAIRLEKNKCTIAEDNLPECTKIRSFLRE